MPKPCRCRCRKVSRNWFSSELPTLSEEGVLNCILSPNGSSLWYILGGGYLPCISWFPVKWLSVIHFSRYPVLMLSCTGQKTKNNFKIIHAKQGRSRITFNPLTCYAELKKLLSRARKCGLDMDNHESRINKKPNHVSREKKSPNHVSRKKYKGPSSNYFKLVTILLE